MLSLRLPGPSLFPSLADFGPANTVPEKQRGQEKALFRTNVHHVCTSMQLGVHVSVPVPL